MWGALPLFTPIRMSLKYSTKGLRSNVYPFSY